MNEGESPVRYPDKLNAFRTLWNKIGYQWLPSYGNKIFFSLGFMALTCLVILALTGMTMGFMGQTWWLTNPWGVYLRSVHLWTVQAFIFILILHILVAVTTGGFRAPRRMVWVFGAIIFCLALIQSEFGYGLRGDFSSQYRAVSGADFWNGSYLGHWLNPLSYSQTFAIHVAIIPITLILIFIMHYVLERAYGISLPFRKDIKVTMVRANHKMLFTRGAALVVLILSLAFFFHSPYVPAVKISDIAQQDPGLVSATIMKEFDHTSDTATYLDSIDPYTFDTRRVFVVIPYLQSGLGSPASTTDVASMIATLMPMTKSGLYESLLSQEDPNTNGTYVLRFLSDMGVLEDKAVALGFNTAVWGMAKDETGKAFGLPPGSWWLAPIGVLNSSFGLLNNPNGDRDAGLILGLIMIIFILFPYIPYASRLPEVLHIAPFIWKQKEAAEIEE